MLIQFKYFNDKCKVLSFFFFKIRGFKEITLIE